MSLLNPLPCEATALDEQLDLLPQPPPRGQRKIIAIAGPTGVGKSDLALRLAERLPAEIISADSVQIYRGMDIGTAKPTLADQERVPHHLIDIRAVNEPCNVVAFCEEAHAAIDGCIERGNVPLVVGGTGFYLHCLIYGVPQGPPSDAHVRAMLELEDVELLYERLQQLDPTYAATITPHDAHKIVRALEIIELSGRCVSSFPRCVASPQDAWQCYFLVRPRMELYTRVEQRCDAMLQAGFLDEVAALATAGLRTNPTAGQAVGYKQALAYLDSPQTQRDYEAFVEAFKKASRHLVKRQYTWFRKESLFQWIDLLSTSDEEVVEMIAAAYGS